MSAAPPRIAVDAALVFPMALRGGPLLATVTLRVASPTGAAVWGLPTPTLYAPSGLGAIVRRGDAVTSIRPARPNREYQATCVVSSTRSRRAVCDLSALLPVSKAGDDFVLTVVAATPFGTAHGEPLEVRVTEPSSDEGATLARVRAELRPGEHFVDWAASNRPSSLDDEPLAALGPLLLHGLLRRWRKGPALVAAEELDALPSALAPERLAFLAERAAARKDRAEMERLRAEVRALGVGLDDWMDQVDDPLTWTGAGARELVTSRLPARR